MKKTRIIVVDDSAFMRKVLTEIIESDPSLEVVAKARNGREAIEKIKEYQPDIITLDIEMPELDGISALSIIMQNNPLPVIMLSNLTKSGADATLQALEKGAIDFITKPSGQISLDIEIKKEEIIRKIKIAAGTKKIMQNFNNIAEKDIKIDQATNKSKKKVNLSQDINKLIVIGTSTGGPKALQEVIPKLPANLTAAVLVVQHMPPGFTKSLSERMDTLSYLSVKEAEDGDIILPGCVYIAPGDYHLHIKKKESGSKQQLLVNLSKALPRGGHRPSVDEMLESVAKNFEAQIVAVIMTGMGNDGAKGLELIKKKGAKIIAEHESTCIVYGMPKAAIRTGLVDKVVPLPEIAGEIMRML